VVEAVDSALGREAQHALAAAPRAAGGARQLVPELAHERLDHRVEQVHRRLVAVALVEANPAPRGGQAVGLGREQSNDAALREYVFLHHRRLRPWGLGAVEQLAGQLWRREIQSDSPRVRAVSLATAEKTPGWAGE